MHFIFAPKRSHDARIGIGWETGSMIAIFIGIRRAYELLL